MSAIWSTVNEYRKRYLQLKQVLALICSLLFLASLTASAQVFRTVDEHGNVTFTDQPPVDKENAEEVQIQQTNRAPPPPANAYPEPPPEPEAEAGASYQVAITSPANETIIPRGPGNVSVSAKVEPALQGGHMLQLLMDGEPREEPQTSTSWALTNVFRGEHNLSVAVVDDKGKQIAKSESVKIFVFRPSTNDSNRGSRPRPSPRGN